MEELKMAKDIKKQIENLEKNLDIIKGDLFKLMDNIDLLKKQDIHLKYLIKNNGKLHKEQ